MVPSNSDRLVLAAGSVVTPVQVHRPGWVAVESGTVSTVGSGSPPQDGRVVDLGDRILAPGFVDLHVHGADGADTNGGDADRVAEAVHRLATFHARHGTTSLLATAATDTIARLTATVQGIGRCVRAPRSGAARVLGAHLEGPWLAPQRAGAHDGSLLRPPDADDVAAVTTADPGVVRLVTLAPELPGALEAVRVLADAGVVVSVGHTAADHATTQAAFDAGARHVTHLFNAMAAIDHRRPGPVVAALTDVRVTLEVIPDLIHLAPEVLRLVFQAAPGRVVAVTDAIAATGLPPGRYELGPMPVDVGPERAVLAGCPDVLAGSLLTMDRAVANLVAAGVELTQAIGAATLTPARVVGDARRGRLEPGATADLVVLDPELRCVATLIGGRVAYDSAELLAAVDVPTRDG